MALVAIAHTVICFLQEIMEQCSDINHPWLSESICLSSMSKLEKPTSVPPTKSTGIAANQRPFRDASVLGRAIRLFELIAESGPYRFSEILEQTDLPKATLHRLLAELTDEKLVSFDEKTNLYRAGFRVLELANHVWTRSDIRTLARDQLEGLSAFTHETVQLSVHSDTQMVVIDHVESRESVRLSISIGTQVPVYCTGVGKVMLAWCDKKHLESILSRISFARFTSNTITDVSALKQELVQVSERGYAIDSEEHFAGSCSIAAPIVDHTGRAVASISITAPTFRASVDQLLQWREPLIASAASISGRLAPGTTNHSNSAH